MPQFNGIYWATVLLNWAGKAFGIQASSSHAL